MSDKPIVFRKTETPTQTAWGPATDARNPRALASNDALATTIMFTLTAFVVLVIIIVMTKPAFPSPLLEQAAIGMGIVMAIAVITYPMTYARKLSQHTRRVVRSTWTDPDPPPRPGRLRWIKRVIKVAGGRQPDIVSIEPHPEDMAPGLPFTIEQLRQFLGKAFDIGWTEAAWKGLLENTEFRLFRDFMKRAGVINKPRGRTSQYQWQARDWEQAWNLVKRELAEEDD